MVTAAEVHPLGSRDSSRSSCIVRPGTSGALDWKDSLDDRRRVGLSLVVHGAHQVTVLGMGVVIGASPWILQEGAVHEARRNEVLEGLRRGSLPEVVGLDR